VNHFETIQFGKVLSEVSVWPGSSETMLTL
jgi:hypothetical protein